MIYELNMNINKKRLKFSYTVGSCVLLQEYIYEDIAKYRKKNNKLLTYLRNILGTDGRSKNDYFLKQKCQAKIGFY